MRALIIPLFAAFMVSACDGPASADKDAPAPRAPDAAFDFPVRACINVANALNAPREGDWGFAIEAWHFDQIAAAGFDTVRLPIAWTEHAGREPPYAIDPAFFARVDEVLAQARARDLNVILDMHQYYAMMSAPRAERPRFLALWSQIAARYASEPDDAVFFEVLNEPRDALENPLWEEISAEAIAAIRMTNPARPVIVGGDTWNSTWGLSRFTPPQDPYLVGTFHFYDPYEFTHQGIDFSDTPPPLGRRWGSEAERRALEEDFDEMAEWGQRHDRPVFLGEFGVFRDAALPQRVAWTQAVREAAESRNMGWCAFDFAASFITYDLEAGRWISPLLGALGRT